jgi:anti-sigma B factor antagonist
VTHQYGDDPVPPDLDISNRRVGTALVITVTGEVDLRTATALQAAIQSGLADTATSTCVVDLTDVTFLGSDGLAALVEGTRQAHRCRQPLRIVVDSNRPVIRPMEITGLDEVLALYHSVDEALAAGA